MVDNPILKFQDVMDVACQESKKTSKTLRSIEDQYKRQQLLEKRMKEAGLTGKRSLIKNYILRNDFLRIDNDDYR